MKVRFSLVLTWAFFGIAPLAFSLTPPLPTETLQRESDLVVEAEAQPPIRCLALVESNKCSDIFRYEIPLKVGKVIKGKAKPGEIIQVNFVHYDYGKSHCVGDQGPLILPGEAGTFYLKESAPGILSPFHWSAVQSTRSGAGALPVCPKK